MLLVLVLAPACSVEIAESAPEASAAQGAGPYAGEVPGNQSQSITLTLPPQRVTIFSVFSGNGSAEVSWRGPGERNGEEILEGLEFSLSFSNLESATVHYQVSVTNREQTSLRIESETYLLNRRGSAEDGSICKATESCSFAAECGGKTLQIEGVCDKAFTVKNWIGDIGAPVGFCLGELPRGC